MADQIQGRQPRVTVEPGQRFGDWLVLEVGPHIRTRQTRSRLALRCRCTLCGTVKDVARSNILQGQSQRCHSCSVRKARLEDPNSVDRMVVTGAINRLPQIASDRLDELIAAALAERERRELDW